MANLEYLYDISMTVVVNKKKHKIPSESINMFMIKYDYVNMFAPIIYTQINLNIELYNTMQKFRSSGHILLEIKKYKKDEKDLKKPYIKKQLNYFFTNSDYDSDVVNNKDTDNTNSYRSCYLGLLDIDIINDNNARVINNIFMNTNTTSIIHYYLHNQKLVLEPFDNNPIHDLMIIPPITGITNLLKYLNQMSSFYKSGYRYFRDYNRTYILSNKGRGIDIGRQHKTVHINIEKRRGNQSIYKPGMIDNKKEKFYLLKVNVKQAQIDIDISAGNKFNNFVGINSIGKIIRKLADENLGKKFKKKPKLIKIFNKNNTYVENIANIQNLASNTLTITKSDIDASIIEPHKEFVVENDTYLKAKNGKYILVAKQEIYTKESTGFRCAVTATFNKV